MIKKLLFIINIVFNFYWFSIDSIAINNPIESKGKNEVIKSKDKFIESKDQFIESKDQFIESNNKSSDTVNKTSNEKSLQLLNTKEFFHYKNKLIKYKFLGIMSIINYISIILIIFSWVLYFFISEYFVEINKNNRFFFTENVSGDKTTYKIKKFNRWLLKLFIYLFNITLISIILVIKIIIYKIFNKNSPINKIKYLLISIFLESMFIVSLFIFHFFTFNFNIIDDLTEHKKNRIKLFKRNDNDQYQIIIYLNILLILLNIFFSNIIFFLHSQDISIKDINNLEIYIMKQNTNENNCDNHLETVNKDIYNN